MNADKLNLIGKPLKNNWVIERAHPSYSGATGGMHCHCYVASTDTGEEAFVKILDSTSDRSKEDSLADLKLRIDVFLYERDLIAKCKDLHMNGVGMGIDYGVPFLSDPNASKLRKIYVMVGCAMRTKMPTGRYLHGAHGAPYFDKTLNLLALSLTLMPLT